MTKIPWTEKTNNPFVGCDKVSLGCQNCYAEKMAMRLCAMGQEKYFPVVTPNGWTGKTNFVSSELDKLFQWKKPCMIFMVSMGDLFHEANEIDDIARVVAAMFLNQRHTFQVLTKRPERALFVLNNEEFWFSYHKYCNSLHDKFIKPLEQELYFYDEIKNEWPLKNVWLGVTVENQAMADTRIPLLLQIPAVKRFVSIEPMLESVDLTSIKGNAWAAYQVLRLITGAGDSDRPALDWVIVGAESGPKRRPFNEEWACVIKNQCIRNNVPFFYKQKYIGNKKIILPLLDGQIWNQTPSKHILND